MLDTLDQERAELKRQSLRRHRAFALGLLLLAGAIFVATHYIEPSNFWIQLLRAGAEAGLIGGLADWFAVTALFRHPFGLPIPHTAIIPRNKERIGEGLGSFVEQNFLDPRVIGERMREGNVAARIGRWMEDEDNSRFIAEQLLGLAPEVIRSFDDQEVQEFFRGILSKQLARADLVPMLVRLLRLLTESRQHQELFDRALRLGRDALARNEDMIYERVERRSAWWVPDRVDRRVARAIIEGVEELLSDLSDHKHPMRERFDDATLKLIERLEHSPRFRERVNEVKRQLLQSPELNTTFASLWQEVQRLLLDGVQHPDSELRSTLTHSLRSLGSTLNENEEAQARLNRRLENVVSGFIVPFRAQIGKFIASVVRDWDTRTVTERVELEVGRDLQYIRVNGTLVGALAGCVLFLISHAIW